MVNQTARPTNRPSSSPDIQMRTPTCGPSRLSGGILPTAEGAQLQLLLLLVKASQKGAAAVAASKHSTPGPSPVGAQLGELPPLARPRRTLNGVQGPGQFRESGVARADSLQSALS